jgi:hypothetical protein
MSEMVERVARAIQDRARIYDCDPGDPIEAWAIESARAAIEAMREPTGPMVDHYPDWQAMIDEALK